MAETLNTRVARLEKAMADIAERHAQLDDLARVLLAAQIQTEKRFQQTDERIRNLVSAIGELIRQMKNGRK